METAPNQDGPKALGPRPTKTAHEGRNVHYPMGFGSLLKETASVYLRNFRPFALISLAAQPSLAVLLAGLGVGLLLMGSAHPEAHLGGSGSFFDLLFVGVIMALIPIPYVLARAATVMAVSQYYVEGRISIVNCFELACRKAASLILFSAAVGLLAVLNYLVLVLFVVGRPIYFVLGADQWDSGGMFFSMILSLFLSMLIIWSFFVESIMFERQASATRLLLRLGIYMRVLAIGVVYTSYTFIVWCFGVVAYGGVIVWNLEVFWSFTATGCLLIMFTFVVMAVLALATPVVWIGRTFVYYDLMARKEGHTIDDLTTNRAGAFYWVRSHSLERP